MAVRPIPEGYHTVTPYLIVNGAAELLDFLRLAFGAEERGRMAGANGLIRHAEVRIGDSVIMLADGTDAASPMPAMLHLYVENCDAVYERALSAGAISVDEIADRFYGDRSGGVRDPTGNLWWISTRVEDVSSAELQRRIATMGQAAS